MGLSEQFSLCIVNKPNAVNRKSSRLKGRQTYFQPKWCFSDSDAALGISGRTNERESKGPQSSWWIMGQRRFSQAALSVKAMVGAPRGLFRMSARYNASSAAKQWLEASFDRVQRGKAKARAHVAVPSSGRGSSEWSLLLPGNASQEKKLWVLPSGSWTLMDVSIETWVTSSFQLCEFGLDCNTRVTVVFLSRLLSVASKQFIREGLFKNTLPAVCAIWRDYGLWLCVCVIRVLSYITWNVRHHPSLNLCTHFRAETWMHHHFKISFRSTVMSWDFPSLQLSLH